MKLIWNERLWAGLFRYQRWQDFGDGWIRNQVETITAQTQAWWDKKTGTLNVELTSAGSEEDWMLAGQTILEIEPFREQAFRRVVAISDEWLAKVANSIPGEDTRSREEVKADFESARDNALLAQGV